MKIMVLSSHTASLKWFRMDMMKAFLAAGHSVVAVGQDPVSQWVEEFAPQHITYKQIYVQRNGTNPLKDIKTLYAIKKILKAEQPDKLFAYQAKTVIYGSIAAKSCGIKDVYLLIAGLGSIFRGNGIKNKLLRTLMAAEYRLACKYARTVIFQNTDDRDTFVRMRLVEKDKTAIIHGSGVNVDMFHPTPFPQQVSFLFVGRLIKDKGIGEYLKACELVKSKYPDVRCMVVGPFDSNPSALQPEELKPYLDAETVEYFGEQPDVRPYYDQCSVYVLPSYHEGTPKTVLEAMASGRAVITTDAPGCKETVTEGYNGYFVPIKDATAVAGKMERFRNEPGLIAQMGAAGRAVAMEKYDVNKVNREIMRIMGMI